jgi:hypothetical protein
MLCTAYDSTSFNFPGDVIGNIKVFLASFNFKFFRPLQRPRLLILKYLFIRERNPEKMIKVTIEKVWHLLL